MSLENSSNLEGTISKVKPNKSPGPDKIPGELIKEIYYTNKNFHAFTEHPIKAWNFSKNWKISFMALIPKSNKDFSLAAHYKPICLCLHGETL
ncbi:hypothetical protein CEXT_681971 [Caerostris extrusa]|uniref:Uncharacterized protein n=1 Tax=Caerostris extrusa TaxID=172846 RepID=A0AAV4SGL5_CAEEX|nr:hypothetical protein CEXT_681971 [Caerostris extrusa]